MAGFTAVGMLAADDLPACVTVMGCEDDAMLRMRRVASCTVSVSVMSAGARD